MGEPLMPEVIFVKPYYAAPSYSDFWRMVELAGYPIVSDIDRESDNCYIICAHAADWHQGYADCKCRVIRWEIEYYDDVDYRAIPNVEIWSSDAAWAEHKGLRFVPMGSDARLAGYEVVMGGAAVTMTGEIYRTIADYPVWHHAPMNRQMDKRYDVATLFYKTYRRLHIEGQLRDWGVSVAPDGWGRDRHTYLQQSHALLNVHQRNDVHAIAPQRFALAAAYKLPMITETLPDMRPFTPDTILMRPYTELAEFAHERTRPSEYRILAEWGEALHHLLCHRMKFRDVIEANV
jgi:hypothetical protein